MSNHFHLVLETPKPNLALGMKWLLGTYRRHKLSGHLFAARYKSPLVDAEHAGSSRSGEFPFFRLPASPSSDSKEFMLSFYPEFLLNRNAK